MAQNMKLNHETLKLLLPIVTGDINGDIEPHHRHHDR